MKHIKQVESEDEINTQIHYYGELAFLSWYKV